MLDNEDIHTGYRIGFNTKWDIIKSLFMMHNESVNVWSHLLGVLIFVFLIISISLNYSELKNIKTEMYHKILHEFEYISSIANGVYD